ncbi:MAG: peptide deformylase [Patescibacteria group bacterium]|nr:peptide deformylase [Patescibacteria group bacterium]
MTKKTKKGVLLQIAQLGNLILRKKSQIIHTVNSPQIQKLIDDLIATVMDVDGVGISACQVYQPLRIFILASHPNLRYPKAPLMEPTAIVNPRIISHSNEKNKDWEGCLSIPGIRALVPRYDLIYVEYITRNGVKKKTQFRDFIARIFQHEYDHLEGIVFLDRIETTRDIVSEKEYQKMIKNSRKTLAHKASK